MIYHGYTIIKCAEFLGEDELNYVYEIVNNKTKKWVGQALTLSTTKQFIDSDLDEKYL